jgi:phenylalanyl-tRNA synthetase alpha chain
LTEERSVHKSIQSLRNEFETEVTAIKSTADIEALRVKYLGKKGPVQQLMQLLKDTPPEQRPELCKVINELKEEIASRLDILAFEVIQSEEEQKLSQEKLDISLPGRRRFVGRKHILNSLLDHILDILISMGFSVQYGPDIDTDYYNFEALNFPPDHPARDMQDTFYIDQNVLLRTHTSNIQARVMESHKPPIRIIAPGNAYRNESITARSHVFFHQVEAMYIDKGVSFADLFATLDQFLVKLFDGPVKTRYRPSFFPFVEPGMEVDIHCLLCKGDGCQLCKHTGWLEICGAGMIHPEVLKNGGIDPEEYTGFAWGMGVERLANLKYGVNDIRLYTENDVRFLQQFPAI